MNSKGKGEEVKVTEATAKLPRAMIEQERKAK